MDEKDLEQSDLPKKEEPNPSPKTPTYVRVLALLGALSVAALSIAYAYSIATGGIFWF